MDTDSTTPLSPLSVAAALNKMRPRNPQLGRLVARLSARGLQEEVILYWNKTRRLPAGFFRLPYVTPALGGAGRREVLV